MFLDLLMCQLVGSFFLSLNNVATALNRTLAVLDLGFDTASNTKIDKRRLKDFQSMSASSQCNEYKDFRGLEIVNIDQIEYNAGPSELEWQVWQLPHQYLRDLLMPTTPIFGTKFKRFTITCHTNISELPTALSRLVEFLESID